MRRGRARWVAIGAAAAIAAAVLVVALRGPATSLEPGLPGSSASTGPAATGPTLFYEVLDANASRLFARTLDGHSLPREVAARTDASGSVWTVDPTGSIAIAATATGDGPGLVAVDVASGGQRWAAPIRASIDAQSAVWSADGRRVAFLVDDPDAVRREVLMVDAVGGPVRTAVIPDDASLQGFVADGGLILRRQAVDEASRIATWHFLRVDQNAIPVEELTTLPSVGPAGDGYEAAAPATGVAVDQASTGDQPGTAIRLWDLATGTSRVLATLPSIDRIGFDPGGTGVAVSAADVVRFVTLDGRSSEVFASDAPIADVGWSSRGDYLVVTTDQPSAGLTVVERATGRTVAIPEAGPVLFTRFVAMAGGLPLPAEALPAVEPTPTPTPGPSGADVAGFAGILSAWVDDSGGRGVVHVEHLVPTTDGGLRVDATMPPIELPPVEPDDDVQAGVLVLPRPGSREILVWIDTPARSHGVLWDGAGSVRDLELPPDWPATVGDLAWRPDGRALAASASRPLIDGGFEPDFVIAAPGSRRTTVIPVVGDYDRLEGWWSAAELRVGHGACFEGCAGRYSESARLRVGDRRLVQLGPADRATAAIDDLVIDGGQVVLTSISGETADDLRIDWPAALGSAADLLLVGPVADARSLIVTRSIDGSTELYRIADVAGRARDGRLADPDPVRIAAIDGHELQVELAPDQAWALVTDRVGQVRLVRLTDGRTWPVAGDRIMAWAAG